MSRPRILLVEDDANLVELVRYNLEKEGFDVLTTPDGEEALLMAQEETPDLVILDWLIANLSGIEVCRRLRRLPAVPRRVDAFSPRPRRAPHGRLARAGQLTRPRADRGAVTDMARQQRRHGHHDAAALRPPALALARQGARRTRRRRGLRPRGLDARQRR